MTAFKTTKTTINEIYISLGSNIKPRFEYLKSACEYINSEVGEIFKYSKIYETPAWGFVSTPFLNACICITTPLNTKQTLQKLQHIEKKLGRKAKEGATYEARTIDLDIIYSSEGVFCLPHLVVPHPLLQERKFVLAPLLDIASEVKHPLLHKNTQELMSKCEDNSKIIESDYTF